MFHLTSMGTIIRDRDNATIPTDPSNRDYEDYLKWLAAGNEPAPLAVDMAELREKYAHLVDVAAGNARRKYLTDIPG